MATGAVMPLDSAKASYKGLTWTENGDGLATVRGVEDKAWEDKVYTLVAFRKSDGAERHGEDRVRSSQGFDRSPKACRSARIATPTWLADLSAVTFGIHELHAKKKGADAKTDEGQAEDRQADSPAEDDADKPDMVIWHYKDSRLQPMQQVQENADKNFSYLSRVSSGGQEIHAPGR